MKWDTAGSENFSDVINTYYKNAHGVIFVYDITSIESFRSIRSWVFDFKESIKSRQFYIPVLVGNKSDCHITRRQVKSEEGKELAKELGCYFVYFIYKILV